MRYEKEKQETEVGKRILSVLILILLAAVFDICITEIHTKRIPHRYASAEEGRELLLANTEYYERYSQNDIDFRMKKKRRDDRRTA